MTRIYSLLVLTTLLLLMSCKNNDPQKDPEYPNRTVLVYISANNNLYNNALNDINEMEEAWDDSFDGKMIVYLSPKTLGGSAKLYQIQKGTTSKIESKVIKDYGVSQDDCDPKVMAQVIADTRSLAKAKSYGIIFWSHATGWIPGNMPPMRSPALTESDQPINYSFGMNDTYQSYMNIYDMTAALPSDLVFDFIAFDACHMATIESSYQLRKNAKYIVASAAETPAQGFNYKLILEDLFATPQANLVSLVDHIFEYFNAYTNWEQTCTLSITDCSKLENLATALQSVVSSPATVKPNNQQIQQFGRSVTGLRDVFFDLEDFISYCWPNSAALPQFRAALSQAIVHKVQTKKIVNEILVRTYCGATSYIPFASKPEALQIYRTKFDWSKASGMDRIEF